MGQCPTWWLPSRFIGGALCKSSAIPFLVLCAAKFGWRPLLECRAVSLPIYEKARLGRKVNFAPDKIPSGGKSLQKCIYSVAAQETAKHRARFGWPPVNDVASVAKPRRKTRWNLLGCPKLPNQSQPLVGWSSPYCADMCRRQQFSIAIILGDNNILTIFFQLSIHALAAKIQPDKVVRCVCKWRFFASFLCPVFPASRVQHISGLHSKFTLRPHHV